MKFTSSNTAQLKVSGEKGDYILLLPIGADVKEASEASAMFADTLSKIYENYKEKTKREEERKSKESKKVEKDVSKK